MAKLQTPCEPRARMNLVDVQETSGRGLYSFGGWIFFEISLVAETE